MIIQGNSPLSILVFVHMKMSSQFTGTKLIPRDTEARFSLIGGRYGTRLIRLNCLQVITIGYRIQMNREVFASYAESAPNGRQTIDNNL